MLEHYIIYYIQFLPIIPPKCDTLDLLICHCLNSRSIILSSSFPVSISSYCFNGIWRRWKSFRKSGKAKSKSQSYFLSWHTCNFRRIWFVSMYCMWSYPVLRPSSVTTTNKQQVDMWLCFRACTQIPNNTAVLTSVLVKRKRSRLQGVLVVLVPGLKLTHEEILLYWELRGVDRWINIASLWSDFRKPVIQEVDKGIMIVLFLLPDASAVQAQTSILFVLL